jgi:hypothetical protein
VQKPREQIADAEAILNIASTLLEVVQGAKRKTGISSSEFVGALVSKYGVSSMNSDSENECRINWGLLGLDSAAMFNTVSGLCTMYVPYLAIALTLLFFFSIASILHACL